MSQVIEQFSSVDEFLNYLDTTPNINWDSPSSRGDRSEWTGTKDWETAIGYATKGWPEGVKKVTDKMGLNRTVGKSKTQIYDVFGERPEIGRFLSGVPDCMARRVIRESAKRPIIDLTINASYSAGIKADTIMNYGAAIALVIDELEDNGFSVGLHVGAANDATGIGSNTYGALVNIKRAGERMDLDRLIFFTANPAFLRRFIFGYWETKYDGQSIFKYGYGRIAEMEKANYPEDSVYFGMQSGELNKACFSVESAKAYVRKEIREQRADLIGHEALAA